MVWRVLSVADLSVLTGAFLALLAAFSIVESCNVDAFGKYPGIFCERAGGTIVTNADATGSAGSGSTSCRRNSATVRLQKPRQEGGAILWKQALRNEKKLLTQQFFTVSQPSWTKKVSR